MAQLEEDQEYENIVKFRTALDTFTEKLKLFKDKKNLEGCKDMTKLVQEYNLIALNALEELTDFDNDRSAKIEAKMRNPEEES